MRRSSVRAIRIPACSACWMQPVRRSGSSRRPRRCPTRSSATPVRRTPSSPATPRGRSSACACCTATIRAEHLQEVLRHREFFDVIQRPQARRRDSATESGCGERRDADEHGHRGRRAAPHRRAAGHFAAVSGGDHAGGSEGAGAGGGDADASKGKTGRP